MEISHFVTFGLCVLGTVCVHGQGTIAFGNRITGLVDAPAFDGWEGARVEGPNAFAQLYVNGSPVGDPVAFRSGAGAGYWPTTTVTVPGYPGGIAVTVKVVWWNGEPGSTPETSVSCGRGEYPPITVVLGGEGNPPSLPAPLVGLTSSLRAMGGFSDPRILAQPDDQLVGEGYRAEFKVRSDRDTLPWPPYTTVVPGFLWQHSHDGVTWKEIGLGSEFQVTNVVSETSVESVLTLPHVEAEHAGLYRVFVSPIEDYGCGTRSQPASLGLIARPVLSVQSFSITDGFLRFYAEFPSYLKDSVQMSSDLVTWVPLPGIAADTATRVVSVPLSAESSVRFFRVVVHP